MAEANQKRVAACFVLEDSYDAPEGLAAIRSALKDDFLRPLQISGVFILRKLADEQRLLDLVKGNVCPNIPEKQTDEGDEAKLKKFLEDRGWPAVYFCVLSDQDRTECLASLKGRLFGERTEGIQCGDLFRHDGCWGFSPLVKYSASESISADLSEKDEDVELPLAGAKFDRRLGEEQKKALYLAKLPIRVLLHGPTGSGKSELARAMHRQSGRKYRVPDEHAVLDGAENGKLVDLVKRVRLQADGKNKTQGMDYGRELSNQAVREICIAAFPEDTVESELFGYVEGAYTDADKNGRPGAFLEANGGTLFIDEIADCPLPVQAKLLSALQPRRGGLTVQNPCYIRPVGQDGEILVDVRIVVATNKSLKDEVRAGRFREDLYYRLAEYTVELPAFNDLEEAARQEIVENVFERVKRKLQMRLSMSEECGQELRARTYLGNVRELESVLKQACVNAKLVGCCDELQPFALPGGPRQEGERKRPGTEVGELFPELGEDARNCLVKCVGAGWCERSELEAVRRIEGFRLPDVPEAILKFMYLVTLIREHGRDWSKGDYSRAVIARTRSGEMGGTPEGKEDAQKLARLLDDFGIKGRGTFDALLVAVENAPGKGRRNGN